MGGGGGAQGWKLWRSCGWGCSLGVLWVPVVAMRFGDSSDNWCAMYLVVCGARLLAVFLGLELALGLSSRRARVAACIAVVLGFLWLWAELAVGVFTDWGS